MVLVTESKNIQKAKKGALVRAFSANPSLALTKDHLIWLSATWLLNLRKSCSKKEVLPLAECVHETKQTQKFQKQAILYEKKGRMPD